MKRGNLGNSSSFCFYPKGPGKKKKNEMKKNWGKEEKEKRDRDDQSQSYDGSKMKIGYFFF